MSVNAAREAASFPKKTCSFTSHFSWSEVWAEVDEARSRRAAERAGRMVYGLDNAGAGDPKTRAALPRVREARAAELLYLSRARVLEDLRVPPGNHLEALRGDRKGQHRIRINDQWRICFRWKDDGVYDVEIVDYH